MGRVGIYEHPVHNQWGKKAKGLFKKLDREDMGTNPQAKALAWIVKSALLCKYIPELWVQFIHRASFYFLFVFTT